MQSGSKKPKKVKKNSKEKQEWSDFLKKVNPLATDFISKYTNSEKTNNKEDNILNTSTSGSHV